MGAIEFLAELPITRPALPGIRVLGEGLYPSCRGVYNGAIIPRSESPPRKSLVPTDMPLEGGARDGGAAYIQTITLQPGGMPASSAMNGGFWMACRQVFAASHECLTAAARLLHSANA